MNDAEFWTLIDANVEPGGLANLDALERDLAAAGPLAVRAFGDLLSKRVEDLSSDAHLSGLAAVDEFVAAGAGQDHFEYVRTAVVAAGSATYAEVLRDPATIGEFNQLAEAGMDLLELPRAVFAEISDLPYDDDGPEVDDYVPMPVNIVVALSTVPPDMPMLRRAVGAYAEHVWDDAAAWRAWLKPSGRDEVEIVMEVASDPDDGPQPGQRVRAGKNRCTATMTRTNEPGLTAAQQIDAAGRDVRSILSMVTDRLKLSPHPALPTSAEITTRIEATAADEARDLRDGIAEMQGRLSADVFQSMLADVEAGFSGDAVELIANYIMDGRLDPTKINP